MNCRKLCANTLYLGSASILIILLLYHTILCITKYSDTPTYMKTSMQEQKKIYPPVFTVCSMQKYKLDSLKLYLNSTKNDLEFSEIKSVISRKMAYELSTFTIDELVTLYYIRFFVFVPHLKKFGLWIKNWKHFAIENRHPKLGKCFTIKLPQKLFGYGFYYLKIWYTTLVKVYFHTRDQFLLVTNHQLSYKMFLKTTMQSQLTYQEVRLSKKYFSSKQERCLDKSYDTCLYKEVGKRMIIEVGCVSMWLANHDFIACENSNDSKRAWNLGNLMLVNANKLCPQPCNFHLINIGARNKFGYVTQEKYNSTSLQYVYLTPRFILQEELVLYSFLSMIAEIGGYIGLLLGASFREIYLIFNYSQVIKKYVFDKN